MPPNRSSNRLEETLERLEALQWPEWDRKDLGVSGRGLASPSAIVSAVDRAQGSRASGAYLRVFAESALNAAQHRLAEGDQRPLAHLPIAVKDMVAVAGQPLQAGSRVRQGAPKETQHSAIVAQLTSLGAVVIGLSALHEFALGSTGVNEHTGYPRNPHDTERIPGGSSSGSAVAVAEGSALVGIGTDTGGSVRIPAALCGVVGFKPSYGTYPTAGVFPLAPSLDVVGLIAPSVRVIEIVHRALGHPGPCAMPLQRVGFVQTELEQADSAVSIAFQSALSRLRRKGPDIVATTWPDAERVFATSTAILLSEAAAIHRRNLERNPKLYGRDVEQRLRAGLRISAPTYVAAKQEQQNLRGDVLQALDAVDAIVSPTVPMVAPTISAARDSQVAIALVRNTVLANVVGCSAITLPLPVDGLPVGLQVMARSNCCVLGIAGQIEQLLGTTA